MELTSSTSSASMLINALIITQNLLKETSNDVEKSKSLTLSLEKNYHHLYEFSPIGYCTFDESGVITDINQAGCDFLGIKKQALINQLFSRYISPESQVSFYHHRVNVLNTKEMHTNFIKLMRRNGYVHHVKLTTIPMDHLNCKKKEFLSLISQVIDPSHLYDPSHDHSTKLSYLDHMRILCEFGSHIAYEVSQPLTVVINYLNGCIHRLKEENKDIGAIIHALENAVKQCYRSNELILSLKDSIFKNSYQFKSTHINMVVNDILPLIHYEIIGTAIKFQLLQNNHLPDIILDSVLIGQVILNLIRNAIEAVRDANTPRPKIILEIRFLSVREIEIDVIDNGLPIPTEIADKIFDPHFTTKPYGMGYGLNICSRIIEAHGGKLIYSREQMEENLFKLILPIKGPAIT